MSRASTTPRVGNREAGLVVPHHHGAAVASHPQRSTSSTVTVLAREAARCPLEDGRRCGASIGERQREPVQQQIGWTRRAGRLRRGPGLPGRRRAGRRCWPAARRRAPRSKRRDRCRARASDRAARASCAARRSSARSVAAAALGIGRLGAQQVQAGALQLVERARPPRCPAADVRHRTCPRAGSPRRRRAALSARRAESARQRNRALEERRGRGEARRAPALGRPSARAPRRPARQVPPRPRPDATRGGLGRRPDRLPRASARCTARRSCGAADR